MKEKGYVSIKDTYTERLRIATEMFPFDGIGIKKKSVQKRLDWSIEHPANHLESCALNPKFCLYRIDEKNGESVPF